MILCWRMIFLEEDEYTTDVEALKCSNSFLIKKFSHLNPLFFFWKSSHFPCFLFLIYFSDIRWSHFLSCIFPRLFYIKHF